MMNLEVANRALIILPGCCTIRLSRGLNTLVDEADYPDLARLRWCASQSGSGEGVYAKRGGGGPRMHRVLLGIEDGAQVDHANHDTLDNRRINLRPATPTLNAANRRARSGAAFKGVIKPQRDKRWPNSVSAWRASIQVNGKRIRLGSFATAEEAARAYDAAAVEHFGEFACLNYSDETPALV